jgi:hypothetical protein
LRYPFYPLPPKMPQTHISGHFLSQTPEFLLHPPGPKASMLVDRHNLHKIVALGLIQQGISLGNLSNQLELRQPPGLLLAAGSGNLSRYGSLCRPKYASEILGFSYRALLKYDFGQRPRKMIKKLGSSGKNTSNHTLCVGMVMRIVEFPAILTVADPSWYTTFGLACTHFAVSVCSPD